MITLWRKKFHYYNGITTKTKYSLYLFGQLIKIRFEVYDEETFEKSKDTK